MAHKRKINDRELLELEKAGTPRKDIAAHFGCSESAICKRLSKLNPPMLEPLKFDSLTSKEQRFVRAIVSGDSMTNAALCAYDVTSRDSAKALGHTLMKNQDIREAIQEIRDREIPIAHLFSKLRNHIDGPDPGVSLKAVDMGLKLHDAYPANKNINLNAELIAPIDLSKYRD